MLTASRYAKIDLEVRLEQMHPTLKGIEMPPTLTGNYMPHHSNPHQLTKQSPLEGSLTPLVRAISLLGPVELRLLSDNTMLRVWSSPMH